MRLGLRKKRPYIARPLVTADAEGCCDLHRDAFARGWSRDEFQALILDPAVLADGCFDPDSDQLFGFAMSRRAADEAEVLTIVVDRALREAGIGLGLLTDHIEALRRFGVRRLLLEVAEDNVAALALYRRLDFRKVGERPGYYPSSSGARIAAQILELSL
ncbi:MAG: GNAT family N-acetyltransferase [Beijerinckiaceae bacterium]